MRYLAMGHPKMHISWDDARLFLAIAEAGSFTAAARALALGQPTLSRRIADLEFQLGFTLFHRGKRGTKLTADGERLLPAAREMARWAAELERSVASREQAPTGLVRLAAAPGIAVDFVVPFCAELKRCSPDLQVEVLASIAHLDLTRGQADLAIRTRAPKEPELIGLDRLAMPVAAFAHESYIARLPARPKLSDIGWITWCYPYEHLSPRPELEAMIPNFKPAFASDDFVVQKRACEAGLGALILPRVRHRFAPDAGLRVIECDFPEVVSEMHLVCAKSMEHVPRIRAVAHALSREFARAEAL